MCDPITLFAVSTAVGTGASIIQAEKASSARKAEAARAKREAEKAKSIADLKLRDQRKGDLRERARTKTQYSPQPVGLFQPRSFFAAN